jgi:hypothetical protein
MRETWSIRDCVRPQAARYELPIARTFSTPWRSAASWNASKKSLIKAAEFELVAERGSTINGICSNPFLEDAFRTDAYRIKVTVHDNHSWSYDETTTLMIRGQSEPFHHTDKNRLVRIGEPIPNPLAKQ